MQMSSNLKILKDAEITNQPHKAYFAHKPMHEVQIVFFCFCGHRFVFVK